MARMVRLVATLVLAGLLLVAGAGSVSAARSEISPVACWNNCGSTDPTSR